MDVKVVDNELHGIIFYVRRIKAGAGGDEYVLIFVFQIAGFC
jgi:hypothetical protein